MSEFVDALRFWLEHRPDLTPTSLSRAAGLEKTAVRTMIVNDASPRVDTALKIAGALGLSLDQFLAKTPASKRSTVTALLDRLTDDEIELLLAAAQGLAARDRAAK